MNVGYDWGGYNSKLATQVIVENFPSDIIPYRVKVENTLRKYDFIVEYDGKKYLAGQIARDERTKLDNNRRGDSKFHKDALLRLLIGLHQFVPSNRVKVVVGQPISRHQSEKAYIKDMLINSHEITVNGVTRNIHIEDAAVAVEGGSALVGISGRAIDIGSGTINLATMKQGMFISNQSDTLPKGLENTSYGPEELTEVIRNKCVDELEWDSNDQVYVIGGGAHIMQPYLSNVFHYAKLLHPQFEGKSYPPDLANAIGNYRIGEAIWK